MTKCLLRAGVSIATASALLFAPMAVHADGAREIQVAGRTLTFLDGGPTGK
ncbi:MAG: hypothetical protein JF571_07960, partial [Asticcacaulis sp.]|nr:hypothetical protein [Asticcacaulis sp.]